MSKEQKEYLDSLYNAPCLKPFLPSPFKECEVDNFEKNNNVILPSLLRHYLTTLSRTIVMCKIPHTVELELSEDVDAYTFEPVRGSTRSPFPFKFNDAKTFDRLGAKFQSFVREAEQLGLGRKGHIKPNMYLAERNEWKALAIASHGCGIESYVALHSENEHSIVYSYPCNSTDDLFDFLCGVSKYDSYYHPWVIKDNEEYREHLDWIKREKKEIDRTYGMEDNN